MPRSSSHALMIVDVQKAFPIPAKLVKRIRIYSRRFERRIFTQFVNPPGSLFRKKLKVGSCAPDSADTTLLIPPGKNDLVFVKSSYGLKQKDLKRLQALGIKRITVCGLETDACVLAVMFSLFDAGIDCRIKKELCWSSTGLHREALKIIAKQFSPSG
jgi:nicotinamidase-related amidase